MAARFWVGGSGTWDGVDLTHISATSGGAGGASNPGAGDTMTFDGASGGGTVTVTYAVNVTSITMGAFTGTLDFGSSSPTMQTFNGSGTGVRTLTMGSGIWTITGSNANIFTLSTSTNLTFTASTATVLCTYSGGTGTRVFIVPAINFCKISVSAGTDIFYIQMTTGGTIGTIDFTGFTGVLQGGGGSGLDLVGDLILGAGMTTAAVDLTHPYVFKGTSLQTITSNGVILNHGVTISGGSASVILADALNLGTSSITLNGGTFNTNNQSVTAAGLISSNTNTRTLTLGSSNLTFTASAAGTVFAFTISTNLTITANTATINITGNSADFDEGTLNWNGASMVITGNSGVSMRGTSTWLNLSRTSTSPGVDDALSIAGNKTITGTFTLKGSSAKFRMRLVSNQSQSLASTRTITAANIDFEYVNLTDIAAAGAANWDISAITGLSGDGGGNSGITFTTPVTQYWFGTTGNWTDASKWFLGTGGTGGAGRVPLIQDMAVFDANSFVATGNTVTVDFANIGSTDWTGSLPGQTFTWSQSIRCYGSMTLVTSTTLPSAFGLTFVARSASTLTSAGNTFGGSVTISQVGFGMTLQDDLALASTRTLTLFVGTLNANNKNVTSGLVDLGGTGIRTLTMGSGIWRLTGTGTVWAYTATTNLTYNVNTSTVIVTDTSASSKTLNFAGPTAFNALIIPPGGAGAIIFGATANRPINILSVTGPKTLTFNISGSYIIGSLVLDGRGGLITITSSSAGTPFTFSKSSGLVQAYNVSLKDSTATGGAYFQAVNSTNVSGNTGWNFATAAAPTSLSAGKKFAAFGGARPINKVLDSKLHGYRKLGG